MLDAVKNRKYFGAIPPTGGANGPGNHALLPCQCSYAVGMWLSNPHTHTHTPPSHFYVGESDVG